MDLIGCGHLVAITPDGAFTVDAIGVNANDGLSTGSPVKCFRIDLDSLTLVEIAGVTKVMTDAEYDIQVQRQGAYFIANRVADVARLRVNGGA